MCAVAPTSYSVHYEVVLPGPTGRLPEGALADGLAGTADPDRTSVSGLGLVGVDAEVLGERRQVGFLDAEDVDVVVVGGVVELQ